MSAPGLFVPAYGQKPTDEASRTAYGGKGSIRRVLPSRPVAAQAEHSSLPPLVFNGNIEYVQTLEAADKAARAIEAAQPEVLGFDVEWQVSFVSGEAPRPTATLQLCAPEHPSAAAINSGQPSAVWGTTFIFHLCHMRSHPPAELHSAEAVATPLGGREQGSSASACRVACLPDSLVRVLTDPGVLLAGVGIGGDVCRLEKEYEELRACGVKGTVDLSEVAKRKVAPERRRRGMWSLADLSAEMLQRNLRKPNDLRRSRWEKRPLSVDQLFYAAADAYAGLRLWQVMQTMADTLQRSEPSGDGVFKAGGVEETSSTSGDGGSCKTEGHTRSAADGCDADNRGWKRSSQHPRLPASKLETHRLWYEDGLSVEDVAGVRCNKTSTVLGYIADCIEAGLPYDWARVNIDSAKESEIVRAILAITAAPEAPAVVEIAAPEAPAVVEAAAAAAVAATVAEETAGVAGGTAEVATLAAAETAGAAGEKEGAAGEAAVAEKESFQEDAAMAVSGRIPHLEGQENALALPSNRTLVAAYADSSTRGRSIRSSSSAAATATAANVDGIVCMPQSEAGRPGENCAKMGGGLSRQNATLKEGASVDAARKEGTTGVEGRVSGESVVGRWECVRLKEVKDLAPGAEYWQIRMVLARFKSGWPGHCV